MHRDVKVFRAEEALHQLRDAWDALPSRRGFHADIYDTATWLASWLAVAPSHARRRLRIPVTFEQGHLTGVMPLLEGRFGRWTIPALGYRPRYRIVTGQERPRESTIAALVEGAARAGAKEFQFLALPSHDPQTELLQQVLLGSGYDLTVSQGTTECLAPAGGDWKEHSSRYREVRRTSRKRRRRAETLGEVKIIGYGGERGGSVSEAMDLYAEVHARSWKGPLRRNTLAHRRTLVEQAHARGWVRLFVLELAGIPAAAHIWFRIGRRAISYSTVYDQRLSTLSLGTVIQWETHEEAFTGESPLVIDYLPGRGTYKDRLGTIKPHLLVLRARRRSIVSRLTFPVQRAARQTARSARRIGSKIGWREKPVAEPRRPVRVSEATYPPRGTLPASPLEIRPPLDLLLAVAGAHGSPKAMRESWEAGDGWWMVGSPPVAAVRLGRHCESRHRPAREIVFLAGGPASANEVLESLARHLDEELGAMVPSSNGESSALPLLVNHCPLPWPIASPHAAPPVSSTS